jgi:hypothetical protein
VSRRDFARRVRGFVGRLGPEIQLRGSFAYDDFHYDSATGRTRSDVDLVAVKSRRDARLNAEDVARGLAAEIGQRLKVSIHPERNFEHLSGEDARFLAVGEYLRNETADAPTNDSFMRAKISLLVLRQRQSERYRDIAQRVDLPEAKTALEVKLGAASTFPLEHAERLLSSIDAPEAGLLLHFLRVPGDREARRRYRQDLLDRETVSPWLRSYIAGHLGE